MTDAVAPPQALMPATPFVGLVPYGEDDAAFFFGRDREKEIVSGNLRATRLTIVYGASGVGKSSLLHAGVVHDLRERVGANVAGRPERARFAVCAFSAWRDDPLPALVEAMREACMEALGGEEILPRQSGESLVDTVRRFTERVRPLLVVLDQFEDYFLYHPDDGDGSFGHEFPRLVNELNLHVNFVLSIREDAWAKLDRFEGRIPALFANYVRIEHLDRDSARQAIEGPVDEWNRRLSPGEAPYEVESALVEAVIEAAAGGGLPLATDGNGAGHKAPPADSVEAPFLQLVLDRLWRATIEAGGHELTVTRLEALGGAQQIVENHLLEALGALSPAEQAVAADLFRFLVTRSKTKIAHPASDLAEWTKRPEPEVSAVLDRLCRGESGRILRPLSPPAGETTVSYELFHDVLAEPILEWRRDYEQERARRLALRKFGRIVVALLSLVAVFAALGIWALAQRSDAVSATASASSLALASTADKQSPSDFDVSLLLSLEAYRRSPTAQATSSMLSALETARNTGAQAILRGHQGAIAGIAFSPDGRTLAAVAGGNGERSFLISEGDGTMRLWDTRTHRPRGRPLNGHQATTDAVAFSSDGHTVAVGGDDGTVHLWDTRTHAQIGPPLKGRERFVWGVAFSPDGHTLAVADGQAGAVQLWDVRRPTQPGPRVNGHQMIVWGVAFSPDGHTLASAGGDGTVHLWDVRKPTQTGLRLRGHGGNVWGVAFSPDGHTLASAADGGVRLWDLRAPTRAGPTLNGSRVAVNAVAFSPDGHTLAAAGVNGTVWLWDLRRPSEPRRRLDGHQGAVLAVAFSPDGRTLASAGGDGTVRLWSTRRPVELGTPGKRVLIPVNAVAFSPDGHMLATARDDGLDLWDTRTHAQTQLGPRVDSSRGYSSGVALSPDGDLLASAGDDGVQLWDVRTHRRLGASLPARHLGSSPVVAFSPDGSTLAAVGGGGDGVRLWHTRTHTELGPRLRGQVGPDPAVAFSPDGRTLAAAGRDGTVLLWDTRTHARLGRSPTGHRASVTAIAFSPNGHTLATADDDGIVLLWDTRTHAQLGQPLEGRQGNVLTVAFSPDGRMLAAGGRGGTVVLWDTHTHVQLGQVLEPDQQEVFAVAFSPDGRTLVSAGGDGTVRLWDGILWRNRDELTARVCKLVAVNLTKAEWEALAPGLAYHTTCPD